MTTYQIWMVVLTASATLGTIFVAIVALFGPSLHHVFYAPRLSCTIHQSEGTLVPLYNSNSKVGEAWYHHLRVVNNGKYSVARDATAWVIKVEKRGPDGKFVDDSPAIPQPLFWSPAAAPQHQKMVVGFALLDFIAVKKTSGANVEPPEIQGPWKTTGFNGRVAAHETLRFTIVLESSNSIRHTPQVFEVSWDGKWSERAQEMRKHLTVSEVPSNNSVNAFAKGLLTAVELSLRV